MHSNKPWPELKRITEWRRRKVWHWISCRMWRQASSLNIAISYTSSSLFKVTYPFNIHIRKCNTSLYETVICVSKNFEKKEGIVKHITRARTPILAHGICLKRDLNPQKFVYSYLKPIMYVTACFYCINSLIFQNRSYVQLQVALCLFHLHWSLLNVWWKNLSISQTSTCILFSLPA